MEEMYKAFRVQLDRSTPLTREMIDRLTNNGGSTTNGHKWIPGDQYLFAFTFKSVSEDGLSTSYELISLTESEFYLYELDTEHGRPETSSTLSVIPMVKLRKRFV